MSKDQYYVQTLRTLYLYGILSPWDLFMTEKSVLKRASQWSLKQMIMLSSSRDIGDLVSGAWWSLTDLLITQWILIALGRFWYCLKGLLKGSQWLFRSLKLVKYSWSYGPNKVCDISGMTSGLWSNVALIEVSCNVFRSVILSKDSPGVHSTPVALIQYRVVAKLL